MVSISTRASYENNLRRLPWYRLPFVIPETGNRQISLLAGLKAIRPGFSLMISMGYIIFDSLAARQIECFSVEGTARRWSLLLRGISGLLSRRLSGGDSMWFSVPFGRFPTPFELNSSGFQLRSGWIPT